MKRGAYLRVKYLFPSKRNWKCKKCLFCNKALREYNKSGICSICGQKRRKFIKKQR